MAVVPTDTKEVPDVDSDGKPLTPTNQMKEKKRNKELMIAGLAVGVLGLAFVFARKGSSSSSSTAPASTAIDPNTGISYAQEEADAVQAEQSAAYGGSSPYGSSGGGYLGGYTTGTPSGSDISSALSAYQAQQTQQLTTLQAIASELQGLGAQGAIPSSVQNPVTPPVGVQPVGPSQSASGIPPGFAPPLSGQEHSGPAGANGLPTTDYNQYGGIGALPAAGVPNYSGYVAASQYNAQFYAGNPQAAAQASQFVPVPFVPVSGPGIIAQPVGQ